MKTLKHLLVWNHKAMCLDICYVASSSGPLYQVCSNYAPEAWDHWPHPGVGLYRENMKKNLVWASSSEPLLSLSKLCTWGQKWPQRSGQIGLYKINFFSEYGHVAYQIEGNEAYNSMQANILPLHTTLTPGMGSKGQFFFSESSHVAYQINGNGA